MRVLFLSDNFTPETNAPAVRTHQHARVWVERGHEVTVVTGAPNFPSGRVHEGYRNCPYVVEDVDGIRVVRVWTYMAANKGRFRRSLDFLSFMVSAVPAGLVQKRPDIVVGTSPQLFTVLAAWLVAALRRVPSVFELRDLWPESIVAVGVAREGALIRVLAGVAVFLYRHVTHIVSVTESFVSILEERGVAPGKISVVRNGVALEEFTPAPRDEELRAKAGVAVDEMLVTYVGTIGMAHGLAFVLDTAELDRGVHYLIVGEGAEKAALESEAARRRLDNVTFMDMQPRDRVPSILAASDAVLVHLRDDPLFESVIPSKMFEAMAMARPVILGVRGESAGIVERTGSGLVIEPETPESLLAAVRSLRDDPELGRRLGDNGRRAAESEFCRRTSALKMLDVLAEISGRPA
jgi:colanic acid biosynthesis glycosyl transferase WcaI